MRPPSANPRRALLPVLLIALLVMAAASLVFAGTALADATTPEAGPTKNAVDTDTLYKIVFYIGLAVIALVWGILFYSLFRFRARRGRRAPQIRGNTPLELGWTIGASVLAAAIAVLTLFFLPEIRDPEPSGPAAVAEARGLNAAINQPAPGGRSVNIKVSGAQYLWRYQYPNGAISFQEMVAPKDVTVTLEITSTDVVHSWWIPELGGKFDAIRGLTNETWFKATKTGVFEGQCAEFCGANHAFMTARVRVVEPEVYLDWVAEQKRLIDEARKLAAEQRPQFEGEGGSAG
jgi:cytochrome c oxidase subunit 2